MAARSIGHKPEGKREQRHPGDEGADENQWSECVRRGRDGGPAPLSKAASRMVPMRRVTWSEARLPPGTTTVSNTSRSVSQASTMPGSTRRQFNPIGRTTAERVG